VRALQLRHPRPHGRTIAVAEDARTSAGLGWMPELADGSMYMGQIA
jgi:hypothetical protein